MDLTQLIKFKRDLENGLKIAQNTNETYRNKLCRQLESESECFASTDCNTCEISSIIRT